MKNDKFYKKRKTFMKIASFVKKAKCYIEKRKV